MEERRIEGIMYGKFNAKDRRMALLKANRKGLTIVDRPFKDVLQDTLKEDKHVVQSNTVDHMDELFIWQCAFNKQKRGL